MKWALNIHPSAWSAITFLSTCSLCQYEVCWCNGNYIIKGLQFRITGVVTKRFGERVIVNLQLGYLDNEMYHINISHVDKICFIHNNLGLVCGNVWFTGQANITTNETPEAESAEISSTAQHLGQYHMQWIHTYLSLLTLSFWYAVTAMKQHSWKSWECTTTKFFFERCLEITIFGRYLCMEFKVTCGGDMSLKHLSYE